MKTHKLAHCLFLLALTLLFWGVSCKEVTGPGEELPQTPDTTSHDWQWTLTTLGDGGSSSLYDVAIIHDSLAYAVGEIYLRDTATGQLDPIPYNLAKWNGKEWKVEKVGYTFNGNTSYSRQTAVLGFSEKDIWAFSDAPKHWDGEKWNSVQVPQSMFSFGWINKAWGTSSSNFYVVGNNGNLAHYDGSVWRRINSGTGMNIYDIYGDGDEVLAVGSASQTFDTKILSIRGFVVAPLPTTGVLYRLYGVWFQADRKYVCVGEGVYEKRRLSDSVWKTYPSGVATGFASSAVNGNAPNDIFVSGSFGELVHWNGLSWRNYQQSLNIQNGVIGEVAIKGNLMIGVGFIGARSLLLIGKR